MNGSCLWQVQTAIGETSGVCKNMRTRSSTGTPCVHLCRVQPFLFGLLCRPHVVQQRVRV